MRKIIAALAAAATLAGASMGAFAFDGVPETIKIGLAYGSRAKSEYKVTCPGGLQVGYENDGAQSVFAKDSTVDTLTISKNDSYHIELEGTYPTYLDAWNDALAVKDKGYDAFVAAVNGTFKIWIGTYTDEAEAVNGLKPTTQAVGREGIVLYPHTRRILLRLYDGRTWVSVQDNDNDLGVYALKDAQPVALDGKEYRGHMRFVRQEGSDMTAINVVGMEKYLCGVVPKEVTPTWNAEAVKAQAVMSRSFAVGNYNKFSKYGFNLDDTTASQVYGGVAAEHPASTKAVEETMGEIVTYQGKPAEVYFFGTDGGQTESVENVWGSDPQRYPYLRSVVDPYENPDEATNYRWTKTFTKDEVKQKLGGEIGDIETIEVTSYSDAGRAIEMKITGTDGEKTYLRDNTRFLLNLPSQCFTVSLEGDAFTFNGKGWGHGIGLSQWGAKGMAEQGFGYKDIIKFYFTGVEVQ